MVEAFDTVLKVRDTKLGTEEIRAFKAFKFTGEFRKSLHVKGRMHA